MRSPYCYLILFKQAAANKSKFDFANYTLDFNEYPLNLLGRFDKVINSKSNSGEIEFKFETENELEIVLTFVSRKEDVLNRGYLKKIMIYKGEEEVYSSQNGACHLNTLPLLEAYFQKTKESLKKVDFDGEYDPYPALEYQQTHKVSLESVNWAVENNSLFRVPLLEKIGHLSKDEFLVEMKEIFSPVYDNVGGLEQLINRLSEVFMTSEYESFNDFFKAREKEWMSNFSYEKDWYAEEELYGPDFEHPVMMATDWSYFLKYKESFSEEVMEKVILKSKSGKEEKWRHILTESFRWLLSTLVTTGSLVGLKIDDAYGERLSVSYGGYNDKKEIHDTCTNFYLWEDFKKFVNRQLEKALIPSWSGMLSYVGSSRIDVKRLYTLDAKSDFASLLNRYFNARRDFVGLQEHEDEKGYEPDAFINKWLKEFGICDFVTLEMDSEGLGVIIRLHKGDKTILLADEGYGITQLFSILLEIESGIQMAYHPFLLNAYERTVCQNYNVDTENRIPFPEQTIIIEEPEIHLHPKFQSLLTDMFIEAMEKYNIHFIIETHSEYMIRRLQLRTAEKQISPEKVSVIYVDENSSPYNMGLKENGKFSEDFGTGFLDEADNAAIQLFELTNE